MVEEGCMSWNPRKLLYTRKQALDVLGVGNTTLYRLLGSGLLRARKLGKSLMIEGESLHEFVQSLPQAKLKPPKSAERQVETSDTAL